MEGAGSRGRRWRCRTALAGAVAVVLGCPMPVAAQVYKCVDRNGHVTYQQSPCSGGAQGGTVELADPVTSKPGGGESLWSAAAREQKVVVGMPKPFVTEGLGAPVEIRAPRTGETGSEVWVYARPGQMMRVGFQNNLVAWIRNDTTQPDAKPGAGPAAVTPAAPPTREMRVRDGLAVGKTCAAALADAGQPDREEPLIGPGGGGTRFVYTFDAANANAYAAAVCIGGRITSVERYVPNAR